MRAARTPPRRASLGPRRVAACLLALLLIPSASVATATALAHRRPVAAHRSRVANRRPARGSLAALRPRTSARPHASLTRARCTGARRQERRLRERAAALRAVPDHRLTARGPTALERRAEARDRRTVAACRRQARRRRLAHRRSTTGTTTPGTTPGSTTGTTAAGTTTSSPTATIPTTSSAPSTTSGDPLTGDRFYVDPDDSAAVNEQSLRVAGETTQANELAVIATQPQAVWLTDDSSAAGVAGIVAAAAAADQVPEFVVYNLPRRDCGSYSSGGASSAADYDSFIDEIVSGLGQSRAVVIVEPDALSESCLTASWYQLLSDAVDRLDGDRNASVYVDAGNPGWQSAAVEASGLARVIGAARGGFAVNVSNFYPSAADVAYGTSISRLTGGLHFVIDTSRNGGDVTAGQWCNPSGAKLGAAPTTDTGDPVLDAELWIKSPGESDGTCNGGPAAGQFWLSYALSLVPGS